MVVQVPANLNLRVLGSQPRAGIRTHLAPNLGGGFKCVHGWIM